MSNLWKALRDVSRDVDPTVGFEPAGHVARDESASPSWLYPEATNPEANAPAAPAAENPTEPGLLAAMPSAAPPRPRPVLPRPRPAAVEKPRPEQADPPSPPRRVPPGMALQFDTPSPAMAKSAPEASIRNGAYTPASSDAAHILSKLSQVLDAMPAPGTASTPPPPLAPAGAQSRGPQTTPSINGTLGQPSTAPASSSGLPDALRAFAPGTPDLSVVAAAVGSPRWRPGDDDVLPSDGRKGPRRIRLRDRINWPLG